MHITHLSLTNFRNYGRLELALPTGAILLHGDNAQGKTNLLEAIYYMATTRSPQADQYQQLINWDASESGELIVVGRIVAQLQSSQGPTQLELRLIQEGQGSRQSLRREALVNRRKVRLMDLLGHLRVVLFLPSALQLITGPPSERRRYLNITLCQVDNDYCRTLSEYNKLLEQQNALLRQIAETGRGHDVLPVYSEGLVKKGARLFRRRAELLAGLARTAQRLHYEELTGRSETIRLHYLPRLNNINGSRLDDEAIEAGKANAEWLLDADLAAIEARFAAALAEARPGDISSARTSVGPHRDDWRFWVNGRDLSAYGSRGQQRSAILALKLAEIDWMHEETGDMPILLLDEVVAELDEGRRAQLLAYVGQVNQALLTATEPNMFTDEFLTKATTLEVVRGQIFSERPAAA